MAEAVVSGVVTRIGDLLVQEGKFLSGVSNQVELLQIELKLMQGLLKDADIRQNESELVSNDIIATHAHTVGSRKGRGVQKVLERCSCILDEGITVHRIRSQIEDILTKISNLKTSFQGYGIRESMIKGGGSSSFNERQQEQRQTNSHLEHDVVGFDDDLNRLEFLLKEGEDSRVASICGMGGLGKTTLAKMVYNYHEVKQHFDGRAWVYISQQCQRRHVWEEILISLLSKDQRDEIQKWKDAEFVEKLRQVQCEKKCLVILDDILNIEACNSLQEAFLVRGTGSKILLTSRNKQLCLHVDPRSFLCELQCLNEEKSRELLDKIAISWREDRVTKTYMETFGKEMIGYCGGLPLAITVLGGLLVAKQTQEEWEDVLRHVKSYLHVKQNLRVNKMGEGFVSEIQHNRGREDTMDDVGHQYLRELVQRCMVLVGKMGSLGRIKTCRMHDLMRGFCVSKAQEKNFLHITNILSLKRREAQNSKVRRLAIILNQMIITSRELNSAIYETVEASLFTLKKYKVNGKLEMGNLSYLQTLVNVQPKTIQFPTWFKLNRLRVLKVKNNKRAQDAIQMLISGCPHIEKLHLYKHLKKLPEAHQFSPNLVKLTLLGTKLEEDPMETLEKRGWRKEPCPVSVCLEIEFFDILKMIPYVLRFITTLQELKIKNMPKSFTDRLHEGGPDFDEVKNVRSHVFQT
ncbi:hypothetical protein ACB098_07G136200 [Castanea mollissima]